MKRMQNTSFFVLLTIIMLMTGCASTYKDLVPQQPVISSRSAPQYNVTVEVHSTIKPERMGYSIINDLPINAYVNNVMLETALKESVANSGLFTQVVQKNGDYVLDVWVDDVESHQPSTGIGAYSAKAFSIWRLTRVRDGKVFACDFVDGSGLINTMVSAPRTKALVAALKDVVQNGLSVLADTSKEHLDAMHVAGIRPSMGSATPQGLRAWEDKVKKNWSKLRRGLSLQDVENTIGPVAKSGALERMYQKFKTWGLPFQNKTGFPFQERAIFICEDGKDKRLLFSDGILLLDRGSVTYYDEEYMGEAILIQQPECKTIPHYDEHSYICYKNPPNCLPSVDTVNRFIPIGECSKMLDILNSMPTRSYYMTHLYVLKFYPSEGLQTWVLR
jgi:uncharacterized protein YceK